MLGCPYKLRYKDSSHIFFSGWNCKDVCSVFYDVFAIIHAMTKQELHILELYQPFEVDLHTERYIFLATKAVNSFIMAADYISKEFHKVSHNSQYILSVFDESDKCVYDELIQRLKAEGYSKIQILQIWIRGEILYYAVVDGAILRPEYQRTLTSKEEEDLIRKTYKAVNNKFHPVDFHTPA
jgi:hypothetical protein